MRYCKYTIIVLVSGLILAGCAKKETQNVQAPQTIPVKVQKVSLKDLSLILEYVGNIKAQDEVRVFPKVTGKIIEKVKEDGSAVVKGETLAYIDRDEVGLQFEKAPVITPIGGIVGRIYVDIGSSVTPQTPVALVVNMDKVKIDLDMPEKYLPKVSLDRKATINVDAYPDEESYGVITKISPVVDLATRTAPIEITIDNPEHRLKSGMFARVSLVIEEHRSVPVVLKEAVIGKEPETYIYTIERQKAVLKKVKLGLRQGEYLEVKEGLQVGDEVVIIGQQRLYEGVPVSIENGNGEIPK